MQLRNLPWLAGRGYNTFGVYISNVQCPNKNSRSLYGSYLAVLFESFTDPIVTGREELGFPKVWADQPDGKLEGATWKHSLNWLGNEFMQLTIPELQEAPVEQAPAHQKREWTHPTQHGFMNHRYVPTVGQPGQHDVSYTTFCPAPQGKAPVIEYKTIPVAQFDQVQLVWRDLAWQDLPTLHNIVQGLRNIPQVRVLEVALQKFQGASDLMANQRVD
ncbi:hypothetical protein OIV83_006115 [Microbotryomycetes sp. JL201]|nr:hypothetical protein OIV83_006115 [Microbotryomycetes sp. JL201]